MLATLFLTLLSALPSQAQNKIADFAQYANTKAEWTFGILNQQNSSYYEGTSSLQRITLVGLAAGSQQHTLNFKVLAVKGSVHAYDFLTSYEQAIADYQTVTGTPLASTSGAVLASLEHIGTPADATMIQTMYTSGVSAGAQPLASAYSSVATHDVADKVATYDGGSTTKRQVMIYGMPGTTVSGASLTMTGYTPQGASDYYANYTLTWTSSSPNILILLAGHLAVSGNDGTDTNSAYPQGLGASFISGGPYHFKLLDLDGSPAGGGNKGERDNQIMTVRRRDCTLALGTITHDNVKCYGDATGTIMASYMGAATGTISYTLVRTLDASGAEVNQSISQTGPNFTGLLAGTYALSVTDGRCSDATGIEITQPTAPLSLTVTPGNVACFGDATGSLTVATTTGGTAPYQYALSATGPFADATVFSQLPVGNYTVYVRDANNCISSAPATITQPHAALGLTITPTNVNCNGSSTGSILAQGTEGTAPYQYALSSTTGAIPAPGDYKAANNTNGSYIFSSLPAGTTYTVYVLDANGCASSKPATITQPDALSLTVTPTNVNCFGDATGSLAVTTTKGGTGAYHYTISPVAGVYNATTHQFTGLAAGDYRIKVTDDNGCEANSSLLTIIQPLARLTATSATTAASCSDGKANTDGTATITPSGGTAPYGFSLTGTVDNNSPQSATSYTFTGLKAGDYSATVVDKNGCQFPIAFTIKQDNCYVRYCSLTQGGWSNTGKLCNSTEVRASLLGRLLSTPLVIGNPASAGNNIFFTGPTDVSCLQGHMPAGGTAGWLNVTGSQSCAKIPVSILKFNRFNNILVGQTITLALNIRLNADQNHTDLGALQLKDLGKVYASNCTTVDLSGSSVTIGGVSLSGLGLANTATVQNLLDLANQALGSDPKTGPAYNYAAINQAVTTVNEAFDNCRWLEVVPTQFNTPQVNSATATALTTDDNGRSAAFVVEALQAYPNPLSSQAIASFALADAQAYSLDVYDPLGRLVQHVHTGQAESGRRYSFEVGGGLAEGLYLLRLSAGKSSQLLRLVVQH
ncbi:hypothetical protein GCM10023172_05550 [Hymenobacter ginsengisoli]|uniref:Secretion system C-terminal sorting domain-containing protein n=2 Tax=Hymenobacteraceae TaxID=1853232 RepID=A0ABP8PYU5_9BACT|nr:T9SS type A sorting domain-containing protein [Hymenobacter sp. KCTC 23674]